ncbi:MotA/TolQ/ExbB proton channel family protein [Altericista sp. CCNU0014]|uniref:MotA/TolQ/ExbB proton channel family protein n=1 Tax=Altericista sp. CCNU0014 TaxID=3082949 RepID=UPI00384E95B0
MTRILDLLVQGGPIMVPLVGLSVATFSCALERAWFWVRLLSHEKQIVHDVLQAAQHSLDEAATIANYAKASPIGRFLLAPLLLDRPTPETFHLALEASADKEFVRMRKGDKLFETVVAVAPLLGLLGTVTGLIHTFSNLQIGGGGGATSESASKAAAGIGEALITTAGGMIVAIIALIFFRIFVSLQAQQMDYFTEVGNELELTYRQIWCELKSFKGGPSSLGPTSAVNPTSAPRTDRPSLVDIR